MGTERRLMPAVPALTPMLCGVLLVCACVCACGGRDEQVEQRRKVLTPVAVKNHARENYESAKLYDAEGNLLPSERKVAGVIMPRGLRQGLALEREWYFDGNVPQAKVEAYFRKRLQLAAPATHPDRVTVEMLGATPLDTPQAPKVLVRVYPQPGPRGGTRVFLRQASPALAQWPTEDQVRAQLAAKKRSPLD